MDQSEPVRSENMPLEGSYAIWNNRGGSGKTTLTYHLANKYASKHPDKTVLLIDMCPQADLSHAFLGDDEMGVDYVSQLGSLKKDPMLIGEERVAKTVSGYLDLATSINFANTNVDPRTFLINVSKFNSQLTRNLYLLCGDPSLELVARSLEQKRDQHYSVSQFGLHAWKSVTLCLQHFIKRIAERKGIKLVVFIDMNSTFSILTEIALAASDKLLIPITEEHMHRNGFEYLFALLYGFSQPSQVYYYYRHFSFYFRAKEHEVRLPRIHLILNKTSCTPGKQTSQLANGNVGNGPSCTNNGITGKSQKTAGDTCKPQETTNDLRQNEAQWMFVFELFKKHPQAFNLPHPKEMPETLSEFKEKYVMDFGEQLTGNKLIRQSVRSHSPLMNSKNIRNSNQTMRSSMTNEIKDSSNSGMPNGTISTSPNSKSSYQLNRPASPTQNHLFTAIVPRSLSSSNRPFNFKQRLNSLSSSNKNLSSHDFSVSNQLQQQQKQEKSNGYKVKSPTYERKSMRSGGELSTVGSGNLLATGSYMTSSLGQLDTEDSEANDAIIYDNMLNKIVDGLDAPK